jgi:FkbM family methyltransferase
MLAWNIRTRQAGLMSKADKTRHDSFRYRSECWVLYVGIFTVGRGGGRVIAFEPDSDNMCLLRKHVALNKLENVSVVQAAASDTSALVGFSLTGGATGRLEKNSSYLVPTLRLDELLADGNLPPPDVIKMDVEGAEVLVLRGAKEFIEKNTCSWIVALHGDEAKYGCLSIFSEAGYILQDLQGDTIDPNYFASDEFIAIPR